MHKKFIADYSFKRPFIPPYFRDPNVIIDPTCLGELDKANFVIYSFETSMAELKKDGRYSNLDFSSMLLIIIC